MHMGVKRIAAILALGLLSGAAQAMDRPGQNFLLKASDLPPPHATPGGRQQQYRDPASRRRDAAGAQRLHGFDLRRSSCQCRAVF